MEVQPVAALSVSILDFQIVDDSPTVVAKFGLTIADQLTIYGCRLLKRRGRPPWVVLPDRPTAGGWLPIVEAMNPLRAAIEAAVLAAYEASVNQPCLYSPEWRSS